MKLVYIIYVLDIMKYGNVIWFSWFKSYDLVVLALWFIRLGKQSSFSEMLLNLVVSQALQSWVSVVHACKCSTLYIFHLNFFRLRWKDTLHLWGNISDGLQADFGTVCFNLYTILWVIFKFFNTKELIRITELANIVAVQSLTGQDKVYCKWETCKIIVALCN